MGEVLLLGIIDDFDLLTQWRDAIELNLMSMINLTRHALPCMLKKAASKVEIALARILIDHFCICEAAHPQSVFIEHRHVQGYRGLQRACLKKLGPLGITVNTIMPGFTKTERLNELAEAVQKRTRENRLKR